MPDEAVVENPSNTEEDTNEEEDTDEEEEEVPKGRDIHIVLDANGEPKTPKKKAKKEDDFEGIPEIFKEEAKEIAQAQKEDWRTEVRRIDPFYTPEGIELITGKNIKTHPGFMPQSEMEEIIARNCGGGTYELLYRNSAGRIKFRRPFEIQGPAIPLPKERRYANVGISAASRPPKSEAEQYKQKKEALREKREYEKEEKEYEREKEEWGEEDDELDPRGKGFDPRFGMGMRSPDQIRLEEREKARLEDADHRNQEKIASLEAKIETMLDSQNRPSDNGWLKEVLPAAFTLAGQMFTGLMGKIDGAIEKLSSKESESDKMLKMAQILEALKPKEDSSNKSLLRNMEAVQTMQAAGFTKLMETGMTMLTKTINEKAGREEPENPTVAIVKTVGEAATALGRDIVETSKKRLELEEKKLAQQPKRRLAPAPQAPSTPAPPPAPVPTPEQQATIERLTAPADKLYKAITQAVAQNGDPAQFAAQTRAIGGDELLAYLLHANTIDDFNALAALQGQGAEFESLKNIPHIRAWVEKWLVALKSLYELEEPAEPAPAPVEPPEPPEPKTETDIFEAEEVAQPPFE